MMLRNLQLVLLCLMLLNGSHALADPPSEARCVPNGTANEQTGCEHNKNVQLWIRLVKHYDSRLNAIHQKCLRDFSGGGSGGFADRVDCLSAALKAEAKRARLR